VRPAARDIGYRTEVRIDGSGPAVVLVHGTPLELGAWDGLVPLLTPYGQIIRYDLRGHGSAIDEPLPCSYTVLAEDLLRLLDSLRIERTHVLGHSFGGQIAVRFACDHSDRLMSLTTICSRLTPFEPFADAADQIDAGRFGELAETVMGRWFTNDTLQREPYVVRYSRKAFARANQISFATALRMISVFDDGVTLGRLDAPVQIIAADRDQVVTAPDLRAVVATLPHGSFSLVSEANHMLPVENPERLVPLLATQLRA
jgi:3-oxoadipate enol-lactonase